jgi:ribosomal-protein-alanine N-acetyltransferase
VITKLCDFHLETERLVIRPAVQTDIKSVYQIHIDEETNRYLPYITWRSWSDALAWYARVEKRRGEGVAEQFVIINKGDSVLVGTCIVFIHEPDDTNLELGYALSKAHWGKGIMFEALNTFVPAVAKVLSLSRLLAIIQRENASSIKLIGKLGFAEISQEREDDNDLIFFCRQFS